MRRRSVRGLGRRSTLSRRRRRLPVGRRAEVGAGRRGREVVEVEERRRLRRRWPRRVRGWCRDV